MIDDRDAHCQGMLNAMMLQGSISISQSLSHMAEFRGWTFVA